MLVRRGGGNILVYHAQINFAIPYLYSDWTNLAVHRHTSIHEFVKILAYSTQSERIMNYESHCNYKSHRKYYSTAWSEEFFPPCFSKPSPKNPSPENCQGLATTNCEAQTARICRPISQCQNPQWGVRSYRTKIGPFNAFLKGVFLLVARSFLCIFFGWVVFCFFCCQGRLSVSASLGKRTSNFGTFHDGEKWVG